ncbi:LCP family protein [Weissella diestrammenae]|uniref:LCP family protein n=1 Tax=Weissella diestrammenae TaxID=1162633 RepID=A0A7G9T7A5_9LACO|nr:LCP family protein [Weissella diestrammenae]MCM0581990.1 LCP family protein [Weissella diestrammenae]QNN75980.1 LCP family protein [Weissella diestrammenae]
MDNEPQVEPNLPSRSRSSRNDRQLNRKKKKHRGFKIVMAIIGVLGVITGVYAANTFERVHNAVDKTFKSSGVKKARNVSSVLKSGKPFTVLLLGTDTGELGREDAGRTDSLMLMTVNPAKKKTTLMSIPRDTVIAPVGYEEEFPQKMNAAYEFGKEAATIKTIQTWLNVPIDFYAMVNMRGMEDVVNEVGGIEVKSPLTFKYNPLTAHADSGLNYGFSEAGDLYSFTEGSTRVGISKGATNTNYTYSNKMDGAAALAFSRMRYDDPQGDYGRTQRQRLVLQGIMNKAKQSPMKLVNQSFLDTLSKNARTDLTYDDMMMIVQKYISAANKIVTDHAQGGGYMIGGVSYEHVTKSEQQRVTNVLRSSLGLSQEKSGPLYAGDVSQATIVSLGLPSAATEAATETSSSDDN